MRRDDTAQEKRLADTRAAHGGEPYCVVVMQDDRPVTFGPFDKEEAQSVKREIEAKRADITAEVTPLVRWMPDIESHDTGRGLR